MDTATIQMNLVDQVRAVYRSGMTDAGIDPDRIDEIQDATLDACIALVSATGAV